MQVSTLVWKGKSFKGPLFANANGIWTAFSLPNWLNENECWSVHASLHASPVSIYKHISHSMWVNVQHFCVKFRFQICGITYFSPPFPLQGTYCTRLCSIYNKVAAFHPWKACLWSDIKLHHLFFSVCGRLWQWGDGFSSRKGWSQRDYSSLPLRTKHNPHTHAHTRYPGVLIYLGCIVKEECWLSCIDFLVENTLS